MPRKKLTQVRLFFSSSFGFVFGKRYKRTPTIQYILKNMMVHSSGLDQRTVS